ncbi:unnamed protein product [Taenia asiatica]|uniref:Molybdopterin domain-containing protein n=1 Tax=Taenia asiatica TaxID=60517 RepID=A0A0R3VYZ8_TAEAS|nr:unnamed protein product [Taenia asiatica]
MAQSSFGKYPHAAYAPMGHNGDHGAKMSDIVLPGAAYTEKHATYVNLEGRAQRTYPAVAPPGDARQDWAILRVISEVAGCPLPYDNLEGVRQRMRQIAPGLLEIDAVQSTDPACLTIAAADAKVADIFMGSRLSYSKNICYCGYGIDSATEANPG